MRSKAANYLVVPLSGLHGVPEYPLAHREPSINRALTAFPIKNPKHQRRLNPMIRINRKERPGFRGAVFGSISEFSLLTIDSPLDGPVN